MASSTLSSSYSSFGTNPNARDDSFSSYLSFIRQSFSNDLNQNPNSRRTSFQSVCPPKKTSKIDEEIDVFTAEKYFNGSLDPNQNHQELRIYEAKKKTTKNSRKSVSKTTSRSSTCSETSANSHSVLLRHKQPQSSLAGPRRSFFDFLCCSCTKENAVEVQPHDVRKKQGAGDDICSESSSELFEIDSVLMSSHPVYEPSEASIEWSVATASAANFSVASVKMRRPSGILGFGSVSDKAVSFNSETKVDGALERYHFMMELEWTNALPQRRASLEY